MSETGTSATTYYVNAVSWFPAVREMKFRRVDDDVRYTIMIYDNRRQRKLTLDEMNAMTNADWEEKLPRNPWAKP